MSIIDILLTQSAISVISSVAMTYSFKSLFIVEQNNTISNFQTFAKPQIENISDELLYKIGIYDRSILNNNFFIIRLNNTTSYALLGKDQFKEFILKEKSEASHIEITSDYSKYEKRDIEGIKRYLICR